MPSPRNRRAFVFIDVALGLALLGLVAVALVTAVGRQQRAAQKLADTREATRAAEDALTSLRVGLVPENVRTAAIRLRRLGDAAPDGFSWVRVSAHVGESEAVVIGVAPVTATSALEGSKP